MGSLATLGAESVPQLMASCPHVDVVLGGVVVPCLVDNGSMVSTITEGFFSEHFVVLGQPDFSLVIGYSFRLPMA